MIKIAWINPSVMKYNKKNQITNSIKPKIKIVSPVPVRPLPPSVSTISVPVTPPSPIVLVFVMPRSPIVHPPWLFRLPHSFYYSDPHSLGSSAPDAPVGHPHYFPTPHLNLLRGLTH